jgi:hypothetical protein
MSMEPCSKDPAAAMPAPFSHTVGTVLGDGTPTIPVAHAIRRHKFISWIDEWLLAGQARPGRWEPVILEHGMANPDF